MCVFTLKQVHLLSIDNTSLFSYCLPSYFRPSVLMLLVFMETTASQSIYYQMWQSMAEHGCDKQLNQHMNAIKHD